MSTSKTKMKTANDIVKALAETSKKDEDIFWVNHRNGSIEGGTDELFRKFGKTSVELEAERDRGKRE